jgi:hypothetical protein
MVFCFHVRSLFECWMICVVAQSVQQHWREATRCELDGAVARGMWVEMGV